MYTSNMAAWF